MPQVTLTFSDEAAIPAELKPFKSDDNKVTIWAGDKVAEETNPGLAANRDAIKTEKDKFQTNYEKLVTSTGQISTELNDLRTKVATGASISQEELAIVTALKGIDGTPDEIKKKITEHGVLQNKLAQLEAGQQNREIAEVMGWKPSVFSDLCNHPEKSKDLTFAIEETKSADGKVERKAFVTSKDAKGVSIKTELSEFVEANSSWNEFLPALKAEPSQQPQAHNAPWIPQRKAGGDPKETKSAVDAFLESKNTTAKSRPNPLLTPPAPVPAPVGAGTA